jgi:hypothetical protein
MPLLLSHSSHPFALKVSALRCRSCHSLVSSSRALLDPSGRLTWRATCLDGARRPRWKDPHQRLPPRRSRRRGARALRFLRDGAADLAFFLLLLEERDLVGVGVLSLVLSFKDVH